MAEKGKYDILLINFMLFCFSLLLLSSMRKKSAVVAALAASIWWKSCWKLTANSSSINERETQRKKFHFGFTRELLRKRTSISSIDADSCASPLLVKVRWTKNETFHYSLLADAEFLLFLVFFLGRDEKFKGNFSYSFSSHFLNGDAPATTLQLIEEES